MPGLDRKEELVSGGRRVISLIRFGDSKTPTAAASMYLDPTCGQHRNAPAAAKTSGGGHSGITCKLVFGAGTLLPSSCITAYHGLTIK